MGIAELTLIFLAAYCTAGALFALIFVTTEMPRVDPLTRHASVGFRLLILPGATLLWPILLHRCVLARRTQ